MKLLATAKKVTTQAVAAVAGALSQGGTKPRATNGFTNDSKRRERVNAQAEARRAERARLVDDLLGGDGEPGFLSRRRGWLR
jgi:hypothetical protein